MCCKDFDRKDTVENLATFHLQADSGGPLVCKDSKSNRNVLFGIVSWGKSCALQKYPGVYTNVAYFSYWISEQIERVYHKIY